MEVFLLYTTETDYDTNGTAIGTIILEKSIEGIYSKILEFSNQEVLVDLDYDHPFLNAQDLLMAIPPVESGIHTGTLRVKGLNSDEVYLVERREI